MNRHVYTIIMVGNEDAIKKELNPHFRWVDDGICRINGEGDDDFVKLERKGYIKLFHGRRAFDAVTKLENTNKIKVIF